jgi:hypothetical protein
VGTANILPQERRVHGHEILAVRTGEIEGMHGEFEAEQEDKVPSFYTSPKGMRSRDTDFVQQVATLRPDSRIAIG